MRTMNKRQKNIGVIITPSRRQTNRLASTQATGGPRPAERDHTMNEDSITPLLKQAYAAELETVQNYLANSVWLDGLRAREVSEALAEDVTEELGHAKQLAHRLKQLDACPPGSLKLERNQKTLQPPTDSTDLHAVVDGVIQAERDAISIYKRIINACEGTDRVTQDLATRILADEEKHRTLFEGFRKALRNE